MFPFFTVLGREIPMYGVMAAAGLLVSMLYYILVRKNGTLPEADTELMIIYSCIGAFCGSKILYLLTILPQLAADLPMLFSAPSAFLTTYLGGGFVFYGGFYGALAVAALYCRRNLLDKWEAARMLIPTVPLFHAFGRVGCFLAGCCYGIESETFGVVFTASDVAPNGVPLIPVQLMEAAGEAVLFFLTSRLSRQPDSGRGVLSLWLIGYGCLRFGLEFLRGDLYRGFIGPLSTSQVIALASILLGGWILGRKNRKASNNNIEKSRPVMNG